MAQRVDRAEHPLIVDSYNYENEERRGKPGDRLAPSLIVYIHKRGSKESFNVELLKQHLTEIRIEEDVKMASQMTLQLSNPNYIVSDSEMLNEGNHVDVQMGYSYSTYFGGRRFDLVKSMPNFPRDDMPTLTVKGWDGRHKMLKGDHLPKKIRGAIQKRFKAVRRSFKNKRDDQIVEAIADHYGYAIDLDQTEGKRTRVKKSETSDWEFILRLAALNNFEAWVDYEDGVGWVLHFRAKVLKPKFWYIFEYQEGKSEEEKGYLLEAQLELEMTKQSTDVEVLSYDRRLRKVNTSELSETKEVVVGSIRGGLKGGKILEAVDYGSKVRFSAFGRTMEVISDKPFKSKKDAKKFVKNYLRERENDFITATGTIVGVEFLKPRQVHYLDGLGEKYSGFYYFDQVTHIYAKDGPYETEFVAHRVTREQAKIHRKVKVSVVNFEGE